MLQKQKKISSDVNKTVNKIVILMIFITYSKSFKGAKISKQCVEMYIEFGSGSNIIKN